MIRATLHTLPIKGQRQRFRLDVDGEVLVASSATPERDACRALLARGITGTMVTRWAGATHDAMRFDIERAAARQVTDGDVGLRLVKWAPFDASEAFEADEGGDA